MVVSDFNFGDTTCDAMREHEVSDSYDCGSIGDYDWDDILVMILMSQKRAATIRLLSNVFTEQILVMLMTYGSLSIATHIRLPRSILKGRRGTRK